MEDNEKKIKLVFNEEKKELNTIPKSFQELKDIFVKIYNQNPKFTFNFYFFEKNNDKNQIIIDDQQNNFEQQIKEIINSNNPEIYVHRINETLIFKSHIDLDILNVKSSESIDNDIIIELEKIKEENEKLIKEKNKIIKSNRKFIEEINELKIKLENENKEKY